MERRYIAMLDDYHEYSYFAFTSTHRAGSKDNKADCRRAMLRELGKRDGWKPIIGVKLERKY